MTINTLGFPGSANAKEPVCQCRRCERCVLIPGLGRSPGGEHGNFMLQYSCLENPMDRGASQPMVYRVAIPCKGPAEALGCGHGFLNISLYKTLIGQQRGKGFSVK